MCETTCSQVTADVNSVEYLNHLSLCIWPSDTCNKTAMSPTLQFSVSDTPGKGLPVNTKP